MFSGAIVYARHKSSNVVGWGVSTINGCGSSLKQRALENAAFCAMVKANVGTVNIDDFDFEWAVDCFDCDLLKAKTELFSTSKLATYSASFFENTPPAAVDSSALGLQPIPSLSIRHFSEERAFSSVVFSAAGCDLAHGGQGSCNNGVWNVDLSVRAWKDVYGPYVRLAPGKYDAYLQVELTGLANVRSPIDPDAYMQVVYFDAVSNTGSTFHRNGAVTERDYNQLYRDSDGVVRINITTNGMPSGPIDLPNGVDDLEFRFHFHRSLQSVKVIRGWIEKIA